MNKKLIHFDHFQFGRKTERLNEIKLLLEEALEAYTQLELRPLTNDEFSKLFLNPVDLVFDVMTNYESVSVGNVKVNKTKAMEILEKPRNYAELLTTVEAIKKKAETKRSALNIHKPVTSFAALLSLFELQFSGDLSVLETVQNELKQSCGIYIETEKTAAAVNIAESLLEIFKQQNIISSLGFSKSCAVQDLKDYLGNLFTTDQDGNLLIDYAYLSKYNK